MFSKTLFISVVLMTALFAPAYAQTWEWQNPKPHGNSLNDVDFPDSNNGWAVGNCGTIMHTSDAGETWALQISGTTYDLNAVDFTDPTHGWIVGSYDDAMLILKTRDGGITWSIQYQADTCYCHNDIMFVDSITGWAVGWGQGGILHTADGGTTWTSQNSGISYGLDAVDFLNADTGWAVADYDGYRSGEIIFSTNGGSTWLVQDSSSIGHLGVSFINSQLGWVVGKLGSIFKTTNGGTNWIEQYSDSALIFQKVMSIDSNVVWVAGNRYNMGSGDHGVVLRSTDGGSTWIVLRDTRPSISSFSLIDQHSLVVVGSYWEALLARSTDDGITWSPYFSGCGDWLSDVTFTDENTGWVDAGNSLLHTSDGGLTWTRLDSTFPGGQIFFVDQTHGWISNGSKIFRTSDGGATWVLQSSFDPETDWISGLFFSDPSNGWLIKWYHDPDGHFFDYEGVLRTTNGGGTWSSCLQRTSLTGVQFVDSLHGLAWTTYGTICHSNDGGMTWDYTEAPGDYFNITCLDLEHCWLSLEYGGGLYFSSNFGITWNQRSEVGYGHLKFIDPEHGWGLMDNRTVHTTDGGVTWTQDSVLTNNHLTDFSVVGNNIWVSGMYGTILHSNIEIQNTDERPQLIPTSISLSTYPNPFNPSTTISFSLPHASAVKLDVFDVLGRKAEVRLAIPTGVLTAGEHHIAFDGTNLSSGIYFVRLEAGGMVKTQKMMLLR
jgi:photosystem II stability/assembly factor-like uncharacterized protein